MTIEKQIAEAKQKILAEYERHYYTCEDPIGCEVRAWQELYRVK